jgi:hypothetical protein
MPLVHVVNAAESREHLNVTPDLVSLKANVAIVEVVGLDGDEVIVGAGTDGAAKAASTR